MAICEHCEVEYEPLNGWYMALCSVCFRRFTRPAAPRTIAENIERYCDVYYDILPDGNYAVAVIDRRPQEPSEDEPDPKTLDAAKRKIKRHKDGYGARPFLMRCDHVTRQWDFWDDNDDEGKLRVLGRVRRGSSISQVDPRRIPEWVYGTEDRSRAS